ncbi:ScpA family protein [Uliginosibacterium sp. TH139]|uniref:segregation and condensation protein A n=1 Tax=Uliginosibacterium sp. TH139 TaxID=2067453 RepID=UPI000C79C47D|nr:ScpA family protein [Uliginosibacterium sp. TH139]PLK48731.1 segregation/condensation protein A [Uliginosibacterium sp. TH139]
MSELAQQEPVQGELVLARIHGEPLREMPKDLYIPPDALEVFLETFEGPLDLLLYLIRRANVNVLDIPMAPLTEQYLAYVDAMRSTNLELAADYLLMAATLLDIKSRMLLPKPPREKTDDSEEDPRAELVRRLMEYERIKLGAQLINRQPRAERDFEWVAVHVAEKTVERLPDVSLADLQTAWLALLQRARLSRHHQISRDELSVREYMTSILRRLREAGDVPFEALFECTHGVASVVVGFLAVLELVKERLVHVTQNAPMEAIYVRLNESGAADAA